jgi:Dolichyl-phosphate-mannose-protein mannosyltransferase
MAMPLQPADRQPSAFGSSRAALSSPSVGRRPELTTALIVASLTVLALAVRAWRVGDWSFEGDELFTLRDSLHPKITNPRPLIYFLNFYLVRPVLPLDEFGMRLLPVVFGTLAIPVLYLVARRLLGTRAALFGALLLAVNPIHVHYSQTARYWSLVFLLCSVYPFALYLGLREWRRGWLILGVLTGAMAILAHPTAGLLVGGLALFWVASLRRESLMRLWQSRTARWGVAVGIVVLAVIGWRYLQVLHSWIFVRPQRVGGAEHLLHSPGGPWIKQASIMLSYMDGLTLPLMLIAALGIYSLWRDQGRDRDLALLLICLFVFPTAFILLLAFRTAVSTTYLVSTTPVVFMAAGVFLDRLAGIEWDLRPRWLLPALVTTLVILGGLPTLISQYRDGRRNDFRGAARWLDQRLGPEDVVFSDQHRTLSHYLRRGKAQRLVADPAPLMQSVRALHEAGSGGTLWIVKPAAARGGHRTNPELGTLHGWIYQNCQLRNSIGVARLDFRQNELEIYGCPGLVSDMRREDLSPRGAQRTIRPVGPPAH